MNHELEIPPIISPIIIVNKIIIGEENSWLLISKRMKRQKSKFLVFLILYLVNEKVVANKKDAEVALTPVKNANIAGESGRLVYRIEARVIKL